jgi:uncharacterized lipoprotein YajG
LKNKLHGCAKTALLNYSITAVFRFELVTMKKYICILASAALLAACEQKTETTEPAATPTATTPPAAATEATSPAATTESPPATAESPAESPPGS